MMPEAPGELADPEAEDKFSNRKKEEIFARGVVCTQEGIFFSSLQSSSIPKRKSIKKGPSHPAGHLCANQKMATLQASWCGTHIGGNGAAREGPWLGGQECSKLFVELPDSLLVVQKRGSTGSCQSSPLHCEPVLEFILCFGKGLGAEPREATEGEQFCPGQPEPGAGK